nr:MAG TPA: hypothetical protein [Caudoviricetes sp.]
MSNFSLLSLLIILISFRIFRFCAKILNFYFIFSHNHVK